MGSISNASGFRRATASFPCEICNGTTDCRLSASGGWFCRRGSVNSPPTGWRYCRDDPHGFHIFWPDDGGRYSGHRQGGIHHQASTPPSPRQQAKSDRFLDIAKNKRPMTNSELDWISAKLSLPSPIFRFLNTEIFDDARSGRLAFVFPERNGDAEIIGYSLRYFDGTKRSHGQRGLYIPDADACTGHVDLTTGIIMPEGASDTLALTAMGYHAIGRPSNTCGGEFLAVYLK